MKTEQPVLITSVKADSSLADKKNVFVSFTGSLCDEDEKALGVLNAETDTGEQAPVISLGIALILSGEDLSPGQPVRCGPGGKANAIGSGTLNGYCMDTAQGADELIRIKLI
jgi:hypothetical protein